jgi:hypothetical protein
MKNFFTNVPIEYYISPTSKVIFVSDFFTSEVQGGAELSTETLINQYDKGNKAKEIVKLHTASINSNERLLLNNINKYWIFGNATQVDPHTLAKLFVIGIKRYSIVEYDFKFCQWRSPQKHLEETKQPCNCIDTEHGRCMREYYNNAQNIFWMSEKQRDIYFEVMPELKDNPKVKHIIQSSVFSDAILTRLDELRGLIPKDKKIMKCAMLGSGTWIKGLEKTEAFLKEHLPDKYEKIGNMPYNEFLNKLASYQSFCFMPAAADTCPRVVIEAKLLGLDLILNENVLHQDEKWFGKSPVEECEKYLRERLTSFWPKINI